MAADTQNLPPSLQDLVHELLRNWRDDLFFSPLCQMHLFRKALFSTPSEAMTLVRQTIREMLHVLEAHNRTQADVLRVRFLEGKTVLETCSELHVAEGTFYKIQAAGLQWLTLRLSEREANENIRQRSRLLQRLEPATNSNLIGVENHLVRLVEWLTNPQSSCLIALEGIGGIGKTALAHVVTRHMIGLPRFVDFAWVTARQSHLDLGGAIRLRQQPALTSEALVDRLVAQLSDEDINYTSLPAERKLAWLQNRLKQQPHLIVLDNLETVQDLETLLPLLQKLCNPSRFLLTSRLGLNNEGCVTRFRVPELDETSSLALLRQEAESRNLPELVQSSDAMLRPIFETVGGSPLALRLVAGQLESDSIGNVVTDLHQGRGEAVENLYTHIYHRAYERLNAIERAVWLALTLVVAPLATVPMLARGSRHEEYQVRDALRKLTQMNLVNCHGDPTQRTYSLHSLTRTFLEKEIGKWNSPGT